MGNYIVSIYWNNEKPERDKLFFVFTNNSTRRMFFRNDTILSFHSVTLKRGNFPANDF